MHLDWTILWREHILQELYWKVNTFCYNFTVSDNTSCYSFIVGKNASCYKYTVKITHLARTILKSEHILLNLYSRKEWILIELYCEENTSCKNYTEKWTHFANSLTYEITHHVRCLKWEITHLVIAL